MVKVIAQNVVEVFTDLQAAGHEVAWTIPNRSFKDTTGGKRYTGLGQGTRTVETGLVGAPAPTPTGYEVSPSNITLAQQLISGSNVALE